MTTAHRPTFHAALGGGNQGGNAPKLSAPTFKKSVRDMPQEGRMKERTADSAFEFAPGYASSARAELAAQLEHAEGRAAGGAGKVYDERGVPQALGSGASASAGGPRIHGATGDFGITAQSSAIQAQKERRRKRKVFAIPDVPVDADAAAASSAAGGSRKKSFAVPGGASASASAANPDADSVNFSNRQLFPEDADLDFGEREEPAVKRRKASLDPDADLGTAGGKNADSDEDSDKESDSDDSDSDDDHEALMAELAKIRQEKEEARVAAAEEKAREAEEERKRELAVQNPLLNQQQSFASDGKSESGFSVGNSSAVSSSGVGTSAAGGGGANRSFGLQKSWMEDSVFSNQARTKPKEERRFVNDAVRSDFHRKFMKKYMR